MKRVKNYLLKSFNKFKIVFDVKEKILYYRYKLNTNFQVNNSIQPFKTLKIFKLWINYAQNLNSNTKYLLKYGCII